MRYSLPLVCFLGLSVMPIVGCSDSNNSHQGSSAPVFVAGPPVTVSGPSPLAGCDQPAAAGWENAETEPSIAINPSNPDNLVGIWMQDGTSRRALVAGVTFDGGRTWESVVIPGLTLCSGGDLSTAADPWLAFATNGDLYASSLVYENRAGEPGADGILVSKSSDGGRTWGPPTTITRSASPSQISVNDKGTITADPADACSLYVTWTKFNADIVTGNVLLSRTRDCGQTWTEPRIVNEGGDPGEGAQVIVLPDGTLLVFAQSTFADPAQIYVRRSVDRGDTWPDLPTVVATLRNGKLVTPDGGKAIRSGPFDVAVNHTTGHLSAIWEQVDDNASRVHIAYSSSSDGGLTWSTPIRIDRTPPNQSLDREQAFLPSVEESDDGTVGVTYYNFENDVPDDSRADTDRWFIYCHPDLADCNDEAGWSDEIRLTPESFDYLTAPTSGAALFLGDYVGLTSAGSDFFTLFSVTGDGDPANTVFVPVSRPLKSDDFSSNTRHRS